MAAQVTAEGWAAIITALFAGIALVIRAALESRKKADAVDAKIGTPPEETTGSVWDHMARQAVELDALKQGFATAKAALDDAERERTDLRTLVDEIQRRRDEEAARCEAQLADLGRRLDGAMDKASDAVVLALRGSTDPATRAAIRRLFEDPNPREVTDGR